MRITALVPAYNEEEGLGDTLQSLLSQDSPFYEIVVVDDGSTDRTREIGLSYGVTVLTPPQNLGSKARAQNYGLQYILSKPESERPDLVIPVDADTVFAEDYTRLIEVPFTNPKVAIAAGAVQTRFTKSIWERARWVEYHVGFHWFRPIQNAYQAPMVCSGCCSAFRLTDLEAFGGFPERTIVEDIDYTWSQQILGRRAVYVADAVAYAAEPVNLKYMRKQLWRWKSGFFQNVRRHFPSLLRCKPMLALWVVLALFETVISPLTLALPLYWYFALGHESTSIVGYWLLGETLLFLPPTLYAWYKRGTSPLRLLVNYPAFYVLKYLNFYYDMKAAATELIGVPLGLTKGLVQYEKGRADTPGTAATVEVKGRGRHRAPRGKVQQSPPTVPQQRHDETIPLRVLRQREPVRATLLDPYAEKTTELEFEKIRSANSQ